MRELLKVDLAFMGMSLWRRDIKRVFVCGYAVPVHQLHLVFYDKFDCLLSVLEDPTKF